MKCRVCCTEKASNECRNILEKYAENISSISDLLTFCVPQLKPLIWPSDCVCHNCLEELVFCARFIKKCLEANSLLQDETEPPDIFGSNDHIETKIEVWDEEDVKSSFNNSSLHDHNYNDDITAVKENPNVEIVRQEKIEPPDNPESSEDDDNGNNAADDDDYTDYVPSSESESDADEDTATNVTNCGTTTDVAKCGIFTRVPKRYRFNKDEITLKELTCKKCGKQFSSKTNLRLHDEKFKGFKECTFKCEKCVKTYKSFLAYSSHFCFTQNITMCVHCFKRVPEEEYPEHLKTHTTYSCQQCKRDFTSAEKLNIHMLTHTVPTFKQCHKCENVFKDDAVLRSHLRETHKMNLIETLPPKTSTFQDNYGMFIRSPTTRIKCFACKANSTTHPQLSFFRMPEDEERLSLWFKSMNRQKPESYTASYCHRRLKICSTHFEKKMFAGLSPNRLKATAVPTIFNIDTTSSKENNETANEVNTQKQVTSSAETSSSTPVVCMPKISSVPPGYSIPVISNVISVGQTTHIPAQPTKPLPIIRLPPNLSLKDVMMLKSAAPTPNPALTVSEVIMIDDDEDDEQSDNQVPNDSDKTSTTSTTILERVLQGSRNKESGVKSTIAPAPRRADKKIVVKAVPRMRKQQHFVKIRPKSSYFCYVCHRTFKVFNQLLYHLVQTNIHREEFPCRWCDEKCTSVLDLKAHLRNDHRNNIFCEKCFTIFDSEANLQRHEKAYRRRGKPCGFCVCESCNRRFWEESEYQEHLKFPNCECKRCPTCSTLVATKEYNAHMARHQPFSCAICSNRFTTEKSLETHMNVQHDEDNGLGVPCPDCKNVYRDALRLKCHQRQVHKTYIRSSGQSTPVKKTVASKPKKYYACPLCNRKFQEYYLLVKHIRRGTHLKDFPCSLCLRKCASYIELKKHIREDHNLEYFCGNCFASFETEEKLTEHEKINANKSRPCGFWTCEKCNRRFASKQTFDDHVSLDGCEIDKTCTVCNETFSHAAFKKHTHQKYVCELCGKSFLSASGLNTHLTTKAHTSEENLIICEICGNTFTQTYLRIHMRHFHREKQKNLKCSYCPLAFYYPQQLRLHEKVHTKTRDVPCTACDKLFRTKHNMNLHYRTVHLKIKPIKCKECGHEFSRRGNLKQHMRIHTKPEIRPPPRIIKKKKPSRAAIKKEFVTSDVGIYGTMAGYGHSIKDPGLPVKCYFCGKVLKSLQFLMGHIRNTHAKIRRYKCNLCEMTFIIKGTLDKHLKLHADPLFRFRCKVCFKRSRNQEEFDLHVKKHTKLDFQCDMCPERFAREYILECHKESVHPNHEENTQKFREMVELAFQNVVFIEEVSSENPKVEVQVIKRTPPE